MTFREAAAPPPILPVAREPRPIRWEEEPARGNPLLDWGSLAEYLRNPAAHAALRHFKLRPYEALDFEEEERAAALFLDRRAENELLDSVLRAELARPGSAPAAFDRLWNSLARGGRTPLPPYDILEETRLRAFVEGSLLAGAATLREQAERSGLRFAGSLRSGPQGAATAKPPVLSMPAFDASCLGIPARVGGILPGFFLGHDPRAGWGLLVDKGREFPAYLLQLCAAALVDSQSPEFLRGAARLFVRDRDGRVKTHSLPAPEPGHAGKILGDLLRDFLRAPDFDDLPLDVIEKIRKDAARQGRAIVDWNEEILSQRQEDEENPRGHASFSERILRALRAGLPEDAGEKISRRVRPYMDWKAGWAEAEDAA